jgi:hypothetical protein
MVASGTADQELDRETSIVSQNLKQHPCSLSWRQVKNEYFLLIEMGKLDKYKKQNNPSPSRICILGLYLFQEYFLKLALEV